LEIRKGNPASVAQLSWMARAPARRATSLPIRRPQFLTRIRRRRLRPLDQHSIEGLKPLDIDIYNIAYPLEFTFSEDDGASHRDRLIGFEKRGANDEVRGSRFIFKGNEDYPFGGSRSLPCNNESRR